LFPAFVVGVSHTSRKADVRAFGNEINVSPPSARGVLHASRRADVKAFGTEIYDVSPPPLLGVFYERFIIQRGHEHTRTGN